jgi:phosphonate transport system substrate-binding protein
LSAMKKPVTNKLDPRFNDANGDLVADAPTDPSKFIDPPKLVFCYIAIDDPDLHRKAMDGLTRQLAEVTGKEVEYRPFKTAVEQLQAMRDGRLHVAGFNTGNVPIAVDLCGFVPVSAPGGPDGTAAHQMVIIVPTDSPVQHLTDLRGMELTCVVASQSGYRAPLIALRDAGLLPQKDYIIRYSSGHHYSIAAVASRKSAAAAVASDVLQREIGSGQVSAGQIRIIYRSENFPNAALGYVYNLKPELAEKVKQALLDFEWKGTSLEKFFAPSGQTRFLPVSFKNDFALARRIDDEIGFVYQVP